MKRLVCFVFIAAVANAQLEQKTNKENMVRDRGQTEVFRGSNPMTLYGMLIDAGCKDRSAVNLTSPAESLSGAMPVETAAEAQSARNKSTGASSASGISVDAKTLALERSDVTIHQVPDLATRQSDPSCAITGATTAFAVVLKDGRILNLDAGGNTLAADAVTSSKQGRAMLNGTAYGFKPQVQVAGRIRGDRMIADRLNLQ